MASVILESYTFKFGNKIHTYARLHLLYYALTITWHPSSPTYKVYIYSSKSFKLPYIHHIYQDLFATMYSPHIH